MQPDLEEKLTSSSSNQQQNKSAKTEEEQEKEEKSDVDLGQYAKSGAFEDNDKKKSKFARLMGGGKKDHGSDAANSTHAHLQHTTFAMTKEKQKQMEAELEKEYELGRAHKGRKGLGL